MFALAVALVLLGCSKGDVDPPQFSGERAMSYLSAQTALGSRVPGTDASRACRDLVKKHFESCGFKVDSQATMFFDPYSKTDTPLVNLRATLVNNADDLQPILLVAHYDSRPRTDLAFDTSYLERPIVGANDGASGVAVLMELGNLMAQVPPPCNVEILLTDAEDWGVSGDRDRYLLGSQHFGRSGIRDKYRFGIVLDMVGDSEQEICREAFSDSFFVEINDMIWKAAADLGVETFVDSVRHGVLDDHLNLAAAGVPTVVIVDFDYPYWHTEYDTPDKCSPQALENVGVVMARIVYSPSLWPERK